MGLTKKTHTPFLRILFLASSVLLIMMFRGSFLWAGWEFDLETGVVISGYNDVRSPGDTGTKLSLSEELETDPALILRARITYVIGKRHRVSAFAAPLTLKANGQVDRPVSFEGEVFPANTPLEATYRFDSYRFTYRYDIVQKEKLTFGLGFTAKVRDAAIGLKSADAEAEKTNI